MSRRLDRSIQKKRYEAFCQAWRDEKLYQQITLDAGKRLPEGMQVLGRKPTFKMWMSAMENQRQQALQAPPEKAVEVKDTGWEE